MTVTGDNLMSGKNDDSVSPYLRRPPLSLREYLKEAFQRINRIQRDQSGKSDQPQPGAKDGRHAEEE